MKIVKIVGWSLPLHRLLYIWPFKIVQLSRNDFSYLDQIINFCNIFPSVIPSFTHRLVNVHRLRNSCRNSFSKMINLLLKTSFPTPFQILHHSSSAQTTHVLSAKSLWFQIAFPALLEHSTKHQIRLAHVVHVETINRKLVRLNAQNVQTSQDGLVWPSAMEHAQLRTVRNVARQENTSIPTLDSADLADMDSSSQTKAHFHVKFADLDKQQDQLRPNHAPNVAMSAHRACNWVSMANVSHAHVEHTDLKEFNQLVRHVHWAEQHQKSDQLQSKSAHCLSAHLAHISTQPSMFALNVAKDIISLNHSKQIASPVHQIIAQRTMPLPRKLNAQIHARLQLRDINIVTQMHTASWCRRHLISSANASQDLMEPDIVVLVSWTCLLFDACSVDLQNYFIHFQTSATTSAKTLANASRISKEHHRVAVVAHSQAPNALNAVNLRLSLAALLWQWSS